MVDEKSYFLTGVAKTLSINQIRKREQSTFTDEYA